MDNNTVTMMNQDFVRLDRFDGTNFLRWKDKLKFLLTALKIYYVLDPNLTPITPPTNEDTETMIALRKKREEDEIVCRGHILNALSDRLYDLYTNEKSALTIWNALDFKYKAKEAGTKKFLISKYFEYKFNGDMSILSQVHVILLELKAANVILLELFQVGAIISKLPSSWKSYRKKLLHDSKDYSLEELQKHLRIEEESKLREKNENSYDDNNKENVVNKPSNKSNKGKQNQGNFLGLKKEQEKFKKFKKGNSFVCGKPGPYARECRFKKIQKSGVNVFNENDDIVVVMSEVNAIQGKISGWWYDTCAAVDVCYDKYFFKTYKEVNDGQEILMGNEKRSKVHEIGNVDLVFTSGKKVILTNVFHVPDMCRNLVSGDLLCKPGIKSVYESGKLILSRNGVFVGKVISVCTVFDNSCNSNNKSDVSVYMLDSISLWHQRLGHIGLNFTKRMISHGMISCKINDFQKCELCVKSKIIKKSFKSVDRNTNLLNLIHSDICELNGMLTRCENRYFITFIDDYSRYTYVYLLKHKDEALAVFKNYKAEVRKSTWLENQNFKK